MASILPQQDPRLALLYQALAQPGLSPSGVPVLRTTVPLQASPAIMDTLGTAYRALASRAPTSLGPPQTQDPNTPMEGTGAGAIGDIVVQVAKQLAQGQGIQQAIAAFGGGAPAEAASTTGGAVPPTAEELAAPEASPDQLLAALGGAQEGSSAGPVARMYGGRGAPPGERRSEGPGGAVSGAVGPTRGGVPLSPTLVRGIREMEQPIDYEEPERADYSYVRGAVEALKPDVPQPSTFKERLGGYLGGATQAILAGRPDAAAAAAYQGAMGVNEMRASEYKAALEKYHEKLLDTESKIFEDTTEYNVNLNTQRAETARAQRASVQEMVKMLEPSVVVANNRMVIGQINPDSGQYEHFMFPVNLLVDRYTEAKTAEAWHSALRPYGDGEGGGKPPKNQDAIDAANFEQNALGLDPSPNKVLGNASGEAFIMVRTQPNHPAVAEAREQAQEMLPVGTGAGYEHQIEAATASIVAGKIATGQISIDDSLKAFGLEPGNE